MTIQERIDRLKAETVAALERSSFAVNATNRDTLAEYTQLTRVLALVEAAKNMLAGEMSSPYPSELQGVIAALADLESHGDI
jgi:hypothetical protein